MEQGRSQQPHGTSQPVNDAQWRRFLTLVAFRVARSRFVRRLYGQSGNVTFVGKYCIKSGPQISIAEANAIVFVAQHTSIPVPTIYCAFTRKEISYIVMQKIKGQPASQGWVKRPESSKMVILGQLKQMIQELHNIKPPPHIGVENIDGGPIYDQRLPTKSLWGPFKSIHEFHRELRNNVYHEAMATYPDVQELIAFHEQPWPSPVFSHGDLSSFNILVSGDKVVGIIDWETAGWYPPYWDYTTAWNTNPFNEFWQQEVDKFIDPLPHDLKMEGIRRKYFGDF